MISRTMAPLLKPRPITRLFAVVTTLAAASFTLLAGAEPPTELRIEAGRYGRLNTIVPVTLPKLNSASDQYELRDRSGAAIPVQLDHEGNGWFILPELAVGEERLFTIKVGSVPRTPPARATSTGSDIAITIAGKPVLTYIGGAGRLPASDIKPAYQRGGYIHPVRTPSGRIVTDDYPSDHRHQHGVMFAWTSAEFEGRKTDFWNMGDSKGRVESVSVNGVQSGPVYAGWRAQHRYVDLTSGAPKPALNETWETRVYAVPSAVTAYYLFDVAVRQTPATSTPLVLPEYHYGGMAVRGAASFRGAASNEIVLTSEGKDRVAADNSRARWAHISGRVDEAIAGIAMLGHPDNFRAPEPMRVHPVDPYICFVPSRLGTWSITPDKPYAARYRFVASDGAADVALLERLWRDYADPPRVTVK